MWLHGPWEWFPLIFLIVMLLFLFRSGGLPMCGGHETHGRREESARELLDRRYARGEISREDYQQMKKDLE